VTVIGLVIDFLNTVVLSSVPSSCLVFSCYVGCAVVLSSFLLFRRRLAHLLIAVPSAVLLFHLLLGCPDF